jgi:ATP-dependent RNA helicase RhlE
LNSFQDFGLAEPITRALAEEKYITPTPIQAQTIPIALSRRDVVGIAQTGTGKTAAFALPILHQLFTARKRPEKKTCRVLVLSPTRELSGQILDSFRTYGRHVRVSTALVIGGVSMGAQVRAVLNGVDVLVATPGRLLDLVQSNALRLGDVEILVLDEADRMLDMGFIHDIRRIVAKLPAHRQTLFFSATMPRAIAELAQQMLRDPVKVAVTPAASTVERVEQRIIRVDRAAKPSLLVEVLKAETVDRALIFTRTKHGADKVVRGLVKAGIAAEAIHGNKSQNQRDRVLAAFRKGQVRTLVATDIAARGIDVDGISHVVNYDIPNIPETYVHRIGRTARAGAGGIAISLCDGEEAAYLRDIEKLIRMSLPMTDRRSDPRPAHQSASANGEARPFGRPSAQQRHQRNGRPQRKKHRHQPQQWSNGEPRREQPRQRNGSEPRTEQGHQPHQQHQRNGGEQRKQHPQQSHQRNGGEPRKQHRHGQHRHEAHRESYESAAGIPLLQRGEHSGQNAK